MQVHGYTLPQWAADLWAWLPWIAALVAGSVSFITNLISIWESKTFRRKLANWYNRRRARRIMEAKRRLAEAEAESEF